MRKLFVISGFLTLSFGLSAQEAQVVSLKPDDAAHVRCTWERLQKAQKEWDAVQQDVKKHYLTVKNDDPEAGMYDGTNGMYYRRGWENGFEFSKDFKYVVPRPTQPTKPYMLPWVITPGSSTAN